MNLREKWESKTTSKITVVKNGDYTLSLPTESGTLALSGNGGIINFIIQESIVESVRPLKYAHNFYIGSIPSKNKNPYNDSSQDYTINDLANLLYNANYYIERTTSASDNNTSTQELYNLWKNNRIFIPCSSIIKSERDYSICGIFADRVKKTTWSSYKNFLAFVTFSGVSMYLTPSIKTYCNVEGTSLLDTLSVYLYTCSSTGVTY